MIGAPLADRGAGGGGHSADHRNLDRHRADRLLHSDGSCHVVGLPVLGAIGRVIGLTAATYVRVGTKIEVVAGT